MRSVVHEIRNHLAVAIANVEAFRDGVLEPTPARLAAVLQALREAEALLDDVPQLTGTAQLEVESRTIDVCDVITNEVLGLEALAKEHGIGFGVLQCAVHAPDCRNFAGDPVRIGEIVNNIVSNAIRYTPRGGRIEVDCRPSGGSIVLSVSDDGPGLSGEDIGHIFERGFRGSASRNTPGSGTGLALAKQFVEEHGGSIEVQNIAKRGARFTVRLPGNAVPPVARDETIRLI
jgi:two-component system sensor histidine kinase BaeS